MSYERLAWLLLPIIIALSTVTMFVHFSNHEVIEIELKILQSTYNGTHITIGLQLTRPNTTINIYGVDGLSVPYHDEWTKFSLSYGDKFWLSIPTVGSPNLSEYNFVLLCDEGKIPFTINVMDEK